MSRSIVQVFVCLRSSKLKTKYIYKLFIARNHFRDKAMGGQKYDMMTTQYYCQSLAGTIKKN